VTNLRRDGSDLYQMKQPFHRIVAIALLRTKSPRFDNDLPRGICTLSRDPKQSIPDFRSDRLGMARVKTELNSRRHFVDVLAAGTRSPYEFKMDLVRTDRHRLRASSGSHGPVFFGDFSIRTGSLLPVFDSTGSAPKSRTNAFIAPSHRTRPLPIVPAPGEQRE